MAGGDLLTYWSARAAAICYAISILQQLSGIRFGARAIWSAGAALIWVHVAFALHFTYHWDHDAMVGDIARQTQDLVGFYWRGGAYFNYAFMLVWLSDAVYWNVTGDWRYRHREKWMSIIVHGFLGFIAFNAVVVFGKGPVRWIGAGATLLIIGITVLRRKDD